MNDASRTEIFDEAVAVLSAFGSGIEAENTDPWLTLPNHVDNGLSLIHI